MPNYKGHLAGGFVAALLMVYVVSWWLQPPVQIALQLMLCALFGSLFPDIDTKSQGQLLTYRFLAVLLIVFMVQQRFTLALGCSTVAMLPLIVHHRGLFHRVWFIAILCAGIMTYTWSYMPQYVTTVSLHTLFFFIGALSHIWLDVGFKRMWRT